MDLEFATTKKGGALLLRGGYRYDIKRKAKIQGTVTWRCVNRRICKALIVLDSNNTILKEDIHNCAPDYIKNEVVRCIHKCKIRVALDTTTPLTKIYRDTVSEIKYLGTEIEDAVPEFNKIKNILYNCRYKADKKKLEATD